MLKFREFLQLFCIVVIELPLEILGYIIVPIALAFCNKQSERLPKWARYFEDANDYYDGENSAINGDSGWRKEHYPNGENRTYFARLRWLYRNRIGYFSSQVNGVDVEQIDPTTVTAVGDIHITDNKGEKSSWCKVTCKLTNGKTRFGLCKIIKYSNKFYCRIYIGWKLMDIVGMNEKNKSTYLESDDKKWLKTVWSINPFKRIKINKQRKGRNEIFNRK